MIHHNNLQHFILGYYADVESRCQVFRVCANTDLTGKGKSVNFDKYFKWQQFHIHTHLFQVSHSYVRMEHYSIKNSSFATGTKMSIVLPVRAFSRAMNCSVRKWA